MRPRIGHLPLQTGRDHRTHQAATPHDEPMVRSQTSLIVGVANGVPEPVEGCASGAGDRDARLEVKLSLTEA
jgi:hypothetical protein